MGHSPGDVWATQAASLRSRGKKLSLLVVVSGAVREFDLPRDGRPVTIGRSTATEIYVPSSAISREHARFICTDEAVVLEDLGSRNGTFVNGVKLEANQATQIYLNDGLRFGSVMAQLRAGQPSQLVHNIVNVDQFDVRIREEAERCLQKDASMAVVAIELSSPNENRVSLARAVVLSNIRSFDVVTDRSQGRMDLLIAECTDSSLRRVTERIREGFEAIGMRGRFGVATYPADVASPESLPLAAQLGMHSVSEGIGFAGEGARMMQLGGREVIVAEPSMIRLFGLIDRVANSSFPVLVAGETGVGKEIISEAIHSRGPRAAKPLVKVNCAALPDDLLESEMFGYEKGAFSGATTAKPGLFETADGGTLLLDEIGEMSPTLQAKLLRVLEDGRVRRIGATAERDVDVRVVAATNRDLRVQMAKGDFRPDLFYRISGIVCRIPPLRDRQRELLLLAERFAAEAADDAGRAPVALSKKARSALIDYPWPGNIRELRNEINHAVMTCEGEEIEFEHLAPHVRAGAPDEAIEHADQHAEDSSGQWEPAPGPDFASGTRVDVPTDANVRLSLEEELAALEKRRILEALEESAWNQSSAAKLLGMSRRTLGYRIRSLKIKVRRLKLESRDV